MQLGIRTDEKQNVEKDADVEDVCGYILEEEWKNFAYTYLASCTGSRAYCSTLLVSCRSKMQQLTEKIAQDIDLCDERLPGSIRTRRGGPPVPQYYGGCILPVYSKWGISLEIDA